MNRDLDIAPKLGPALAGENPLTMHASTRRAYRGLSRSELIHGALHTSTCRCRSCAACEPAVRPVADELTFVQIGWIAWAAILLVSAVMFAIDPHGSWHALTSCFVGL